MKKSVFSIAVLSALILIFAACSNSSGGGSGDGGNNGSGDNVKTHAPVTQVIGSDGGEIKSGNDIIVTFPAGALSEEKDISVKYIESPKEIHEWPSDFIGGVEFGPDGTVFDEPVEVKIKLPENTSDSSISVFCYDEEEDIWDFVSQATVEEGYAKFSVKHFSIYELQEKFPTKTDKFVELVDTAMATGKSDDWIMSQFTDYLINQEKVLDGYKYYDGYYFEPCGIHISGDYDINGKGNKASMINTIGTSNMVGNKFGYSWIESGGYSESISHKEYKRRKEKVKESQKLYSAWYIIDYQMIEPQIEMTAEKTNLKKGESTKVEVFCHYGDLILNGYELELTSKLKHFKTNVNKITTGANGKASFTVTAVSEGSESIKAIFDRTGYLTGRPEGKVHAEKAVTFTCGKELNKIMISGHIEETVSYTIDKKIENQYFSSKGQGGMTIKIEYDFEGKLENVSYIEEGEFLGNVEFSNYKVDVSSSPVSWAWYVDGKNHYDEIDYILDKYTVNELGVGAGYCIAKIKDASINFTDDCSFISGIAIMDNGKSEKDGVSSGDSFHYDGGTDVNLGIEVAKLYSVPLENGTSEITENEFKDEFTISDTSIYNYDKISSSTKQTMIVKLVYGDDNLEEE